jgi:RimJ/RimL family protein N-acetyltransferase
MSSTVDPVTNREYLIAPNEISYQDSELPVLLRPLEKGDAEVIHEAVMLSLESFRPFMDWAHRESSVEGQLQRIRKSKEGFAKGTEFDFSVFDKNTGEFFMSATLGPSRTPNKKALSIGYWTSIKHCNKGLATLITKILTIVAFDYMGCNRVEIGCNKANKKSVRVIEKCGFIFEGEARNYFTEPTPEMIQNGYYPDRTCLQYALIAQDLKSLPWFEEIKSKLLIKP